MKNIFILGSKGIPANYGGFETFVENLTQKKVSKNIKYYVACMANDENVLEYNDSICFHVKVPEIGSAKAVYYDLLALKKTIKYIKENHLSNCIVYILACRIGPFIGHYKKILKKMNVTLIVNPDGYEWKRSKWNYFIKKYWKYSEKLMVKHADLLICDSINIEQYIKKEYSQYQPNTTFIAYGADLKRSQMQDDDKMLLDWYAKFDLKKNEYYLVVGRFVPENNYETMLKEFMKSNTKKDLVLITNVEENKFFNYLKETTNFKTDKRIKFVGTVYHSELIKKIRENAYGYLHGHSVGGTNPSLIEALAATNLNLLYDVGFNREVAIDGALYWNQEENNLASLLDKAEQLSQEEIEQLSKKAIQRINHAYSWEKIIKDYETIFMK